MSHWFFDDYLPTWIGVGAGTIARGPEFILDYWAVRPCTGATTRAASGFLDAPAVVALLDAVADPTARRGYAYTAVPDQKVTVYHHNGAAIEVIWSRRRSDGTEIERVAAHFEVARGPAGWRIVGIQAAPTTSDSLNAVWPQAN